MISRYWVLNCEAAETAVINCNGLDLVSPTVQYLLIMTAEDAKDAEVKGGLFPTSASLVSSAVQSMNY